MAVSDPTFLVTSIPEFISEFQDFTEEFTFDGTESQGVTVQDIEFNVNGIANQTCVLMGTINETELFFNCNGDAVDEQDAATGIVVVNFSFVIQDV